MIPSERELVVIFRGIANHLADSGLELKPAMNAVVNTEGLLSREIATLARSLQETNRLLHLDESATPELNAINHSRAILAARDIKELPVPFSFDFRDRSARKLWTQVLYQLIEDGNNETGTIYRSPSEIGTPLDVFHWYLWDGWGRYAAIMSGIPTANKEQIIGAGWFTGASIEASVVLAEHGEQDQRQIVRSMVGMGFVSSTYEPTSRISSRASAVAQD